MLARKRGVHEFIARFDGTPMKHSWTGKESFRFIPENLPKGDTPGLSSNIPILSSRAAKALADLLEPSGELLPITCQGEDYFIFNVTRIVDTLDEDKSDVVRFDDGRILDVHRYSFVKRKLAGEAVFRLPQMLLGCIYTTDPFVERVKAAGLKGFKFPLLWSSDK